METLPSDLWKVIFSFIPAHRYAVRCTCKAFQALLQVEGAARITPRSILETREAGGDPTWLKEAIGNWGKAHAIVLLAQAAEATHTRAM